MKNWYILQGIFCAGGKENGPGMSIHKFDLQKREGKKNPTGDF